MPEVLVYRTTDGLAVGEGQELTVLDIREGELGAVLAGLPPGESLADSLRARPVRGRVGLDEVSLLAPVDLHDDILLVGANYADHVAEAGLRTPEVPLFLRVSRSGSTGPRSDVRLPSESPRQVDFEGELVVVIGAAGEDIPVAEAWRFVAGLTVGNDLSARDVQATGMGDGGVLDASRIARAKSFPTFKPLGPGVLLTEGLTEQPDLALETYVNGERRQAARTGEMLFSLAEMISFASRSGPLRPGDLLFTGTPAGVGLVDGRFLSPGDVVETYIEGIGSLVNHVVS